MAYRIEKEMYPVVCNWLTQFLQNRHRKAIIDVFDNSQKSLARLIKEKYLFENLPSEWESWDIHVDIVGFIRTEKRTSIALVECKNEKLNLSHLSQTIGYSRIVRPDYSILVAPQGASDSLRSLLLSFERIDVLQYHMPKGKLPLSIAVASWNETANTVEMSSIISGNDNVWR